MSKKLLLPMAGVTLFLATTQHGLAQNKPTNTAKPKTEQEFKYIADQFADLRILP